MKCKHCNFELDQEYDICPECGKSLKDEPEVVEEKIELPETKDETALSKEDQFTANFISKDDPLKHISEVKDSNAGIKVARIAALLAVLFFGGVLYYSYVYLPKHQPKQQGGVNEIIDDYVPDRTTPISSNTTGEVEFVATFGDETIGTQMKKNGFDYDKDMYTVNVTMDFGKLSGGQKFQLKLNRTPSGSSFSDVISFVYNDAPISGLSKIYTNYSEDLITNMINSYVVKEFDGGVIMYSTASSFQLGHSNPILIFKNSKLNKIEKVITTYSLDGATIGQCPITINGSTVSYCAYVYEFKKSENVEIRNITYQFDKEEVVTGAFQGMISK